MRKKILILTLGIILGMSLYLCYDDKNIFLRKVNNIDFLTNEQNDNNVKLITNNYASNDIILTTLKEGETEAKSNTIKLQNAINTVSDAGGGTVYLPSGTYYFGLGGYNNNNDNDKGAFVIKCRNNVHIKGMGTNENSSSYTVLKPIYNNPSGIGGMDMFYFNNYKDTGFNGDKVTLNTKRDVSHFDISGKEVIWKDQTVYLINADFSDFVIDGDGSRGGIANANGFYRTNGKGFMINLFADCDWNNVVVKNVDATGFGVDCPINSTITNCKAINCGKAATKQSDGGASGFGIGTGFSNEESLVIENSIAINNKKFGFFFEHQSRFSDVNYKATKSKGFVVSNSIAGGNMYDFGGLKSYDVTFENNKSVSNLYSYLVPGIKSTNTNGGKYKYTELKFKDNKVILNKNVQPLYFSSYSTNSLSVNTDIFYMVNDVKDYVEEIKWAVNSGIVPVSSVSSFEPNKKVTRIDVIRSLYEFSGKDSNVLTNSEWKNISFYRNKIADIGFNDLASGFDYDLDAVLWAYNNGIISKDKNFRPNANCTRAELVTMLYRMAGKPNVTGNIDFNDVPANSWYYNAVLWAYNNGITKGTYSNTFAPSESLSKLQLSLFLYRYKTTISNHNYKVKINVIGGTHNNIISYNIKTNYVLKAPIRKGYTFIGWTGSNGSVMSKNVTIKSGTSGNLSYTANWEPNLEEIFIKKLPTLTTYIINDELNTNGLVVVGKYGDNNVKEINDYNVDTTVLNNLGVHKVTIYYLNKTTSFEVNVIDNDVNNISKINIFKKPIKTKYFVGEKINSDEIQIEVFSVDGSSYVLSSGFSIEPSSFNKVGSTDVIVKYKNKITSFKVEVVSDDTEKVGIFKKIINFFEKLFHSFRK